jgi:hypothetical protein
MNGSCSIREKASNYTYKIPPAKTVFAFSKVAATEEDQGFLHSFPFPTIAYTQRPVFLGHILAT